MVEAEITGIRERVIRRVNEFPVTKLLTVQNYVEYVATGEWDINKEYGIPLDGLDYELARAADEDRDDEEFDFGVLLEECGLTYADLQD
jgi:hypothetical protein